MGEAKSGRGKRRVQCRGLGWVVLLSGTLLLLVWAVLVAGRRATAQTVPAIVINEIQYNPRSGDAGEEYIELYNAGSTPVDLSGWAFVDGIVYTFTAGTVISPGGYLVVGHDPATIEATYGISGVLGPFASGKLSNGGERVALADDLGTLVDGVTYDDHHPWPEEPDGNGPSLELINPAFDNDRPCSWAASSGLGTPGAPNSAYASGNVIHDAMRGFPPPDGIELSDMVTPAVVLDNEVYNILDDCLDLNHASAVIERNELHDCGNKGISIGWPSTTTLVNNLIYATEIGVAVKDSAVSRLVNNTLADNQYGLWLYEDHTGEGAGLATVVNSILWGNQVRDIELDLAHGAAITVTYSIVQEARPGEGNLTDDPLFQAPASRVYRLREDSPAVDSATPEGAPAEDIWGVPRPQGAGYDRGAHEFFEFYTVYLPLVLR